MAVKNNSKKMNFESIIVAAALIIFPFVKTDFNTLIDFELLPKQLFAGVLAIILVGIFLKFKTKAPLINLATGGYLLFLIAHFISMSSAINMAEAWATSVRNLVYGGLLFGLVSGFYHKRLQLDVIAKGGTVFLLIIGLFSLPDIIEAYKSKSPLDALYGFKELYVHKNFLASALLLALPLAAMTILEKQKPWRIAGIVAIGIALLDMALLRTRSVYLALVVAFAVVVILYFILSKNKADSKKIVKFIGIGLGGFVVVTLIIFSTTKISENLFNTSNLDLRYNYWNSSIEMIKESPVTGIGAGNWRINFVKQGLRGLNKSIIDGYTTINRPHNDILWVFSETGIIGLIGFLGFLCFSLWYTLKAAMAEELQTHKLFYIFSFVGILSFVIYGLFEFPLERPEHMVFLILYASIGISGFIKLQNGQKFLVPNQIVLGAFMLSTLFSVYAINTRVASAKAAKKAVDAFSKRNPKAMMQSGQEAAQVYYSLDDFGNPVAFFEGMGKLATKNIKGAEQAFGRALEAHPFHILSNIQMGNTLRNSSRYVEAEEYYSAALSVSPLNEQALLNRVEVFLLQNNWQKALEDLRSLTPNPQNQRYMNALNQTMSEYYKNPPIEKFGGMNKFLKGANNLNELTEKFINWRKRAIDKQNKMNQEKF